MAATDTGSEFSWPSDKMKAWDVGNQLMKTISISRRTKSVNALLKRARRENIILRSPEGEEFVLAELNDFDREIELTRQNRSLMTFLEARARQRNGVA
ncbi:MAG: hypothetical protein ACLQOO_31570 [Terriglobia bacterium]